MAEIVNATESMVRAVTDEPIVRSVRAIAAVEGGRVLGVTGFYPENGHLVLVAAIAADARAEFGRHKRTLVRCARRVMEMAASLGMPIYAHADPLITGSDRLLAHMGFAPLPQHKDIYTWPGHR